MKINHFKLRELCEQKKKKDGGFTTNDLHKAIRAKGATISLETLKAYRKGNIKEPSSSVLKMIAEVLGTDVLNLVEDGDSFKEHFRLAGNNSSNNVDVLYFENSYTSLGAGMINYEEVPRPMTFDKTFLQEKVGNYTFEKMHIINARGDSMYPLIKEGEMLFVNPFENEGNIIQNGAIYTLSIGDAVMTKRIEKDPFNEEYVLHSENTRYKSITLKKEKLSELKIIGRVIAHFNFL